jgi:bacterioferritin-associated ferredoxin
MEMHSIYKQFTDVATNVWLSEKHKLWLCKDLRKSLPARSMCGQCGDTYDIIDSLMRTAVEELTNAAGRAEAHEAPVVAPKTEEKQPPKASTRKPKAKKPRTKK